MRYVDVGGARMSAVGLGCWQFGSMEWGYGKEYLEKDAIDIVHRALDLGVTLIDTAEIYGFGKSERAVGRALEGRRDEAFIATKVFPVLPIAPVVEQRGRASARRLGIDTIDLYQIHQPNPVVPIANQMEGMRRLQQKGVVRHVGVSNFSLSKWQAAERAHGGPVLSNQVSYSLVQRKPDEELVGIARDNDRRIIASSPLDPTPLSGGRVVGRRSSAPLAGLHETGDLGHFEAHGFREPATGDEVVHPAEGAMAEVHRLDVVQAGAALDGLDVEPGVQLLGHTVLE